MEMGDTIKVQQKRQTNVKESERLLLWASASAPAVLASLAIRKSFIGIVPIIVIIFFPDSFFMDDLYMGYSVL